MENKPDKHLNNPTNRTNRLDTYGSEKVSFVETSKVKQGVHCDVYKFDNTDEKDLGIIRVQKGEKTPLQKVLDGEKTIEVFVSGKGALTVVTNIGEKIKYQYPGGQSEVVVAVGDLMQWEALEDLVFAEICYPPYQEGRFENIKEE